MKIKIYLFKIFQIMRYLFFKTNAIFFEKKIFFLFNNLTNKLFLDLIP
jgi:hypothetical protein